MNYNIATVDELIKYIDNQYKHAKSKGWSRMSVDWGKWSREMNLVLRERIEALEAKENLCVQLKCVYIYWLVRSQLLELHYKGKKWLYKSKRRILVNQLKELLEIIDDPLSMKAEKLPDNFMDMVLQGLKK